MSIVTMGICVECYRAWAVEMHDFGSSDIEFFFDGMVSAEAHLVAMKDETSMHRISPTLMYVEDE